MGSGRAVLGTCASLLEGLAGPVLDKELRVTSRRKRHYLLRFAYLAALTGVVLLYWQDPRLEPADFARAARMADIGQTITSRVLLFQATAAQVLALILLAGGISGEYAAGTVWSLLTTPIRPLQLVVGKLLGGLLQVLTLLAISLPVLAIVRIFGGVTWGQLIACFCLTVCGAVFVGSLALWTSAGSSNTLTAVSGTIGVYCLYHAALGMIAILARGWLPLYEAEIASMLPAPTLSVGMVIAQFEAVPGLPANWLIHCASLLGVSFLFLLGAAWRVERFVPRVLERSTLSGGVLAPREPGRRTRAGGSIVRGQAILWKDLRSFLPTDIRWLIPPVFITVLLVVLIYRMAWESGGFNSRPFHLLLPGAMLIGAWLMIACLAATSLTCEKQTRALPILLTAPLDDWQILGHKAMAVAGRSALLWGGFLAHLLGFTVSGHLRITGVLELAALLAVVSLFLYGLGTYVSARCRGNSAATIIVLGICAVLWIVLPSLPLGGLGTGPVSLPALINPIYHFANIVGETVKGDLSPATFADGDSFPCFCGLLVGAGGLLLYRGKVQMRRRVFA